METIFNITDYGAIGDGTVDCTEAVQNALNDMAKDGTLAEIATKWFGADITVVGK